MSVRVQTPTTESRRDQEEGEELDSQEEVRHFCGSRRDQEEGGELDFQEEDRHFCGSRRDQEEGGELDSQEEVRQARSRGSRGGRWCWTHKLAQKRS